MKKTVLSLLLCLCLSLAPTQRSQAFIFPLVTAVIKKVIQAIDLAIQRLQNKTIWLQEAQKQLENTMSKLQLDKIADWVGKQKELYQEYYDELKKVKDIIQYYERIKSITRQQVQMVNAYKKAWATIQKDAHFTEAERRYMNRVYTGILDESVKNLDLVFTVLHSWSLSMTDAKRMEIIDQSADELDKNCADLMEFNRQNTWLSLSRARDQQDVNTLKHLYGL
jgi:hypothetical protein